MVRVESFLDLQKQIVQPCWLPILNPQHNTILGFRLRRYLKLRHYRLKSKRKNTSNLTWDLESFASPYIDQILLKFCSYWQKKRPAKYSEHEHDEPIKTLHETFSFWLFWISKSSIYIKSFWCCLVRTPLTLWLIHSSFSRENGHPGCAWMLNTTNDPPKKQVSQSKVQSYWITIRRKTQHFPATEPKVIWFVFWKLSFLTSPLKKKEKQQPISPFCCIFSWGFQHVIVLKTDLHWVAISARGAVVRLFLRLFTTVPFREPHTEPARERLERGKNGGIFSSPKTWGKTGYTPEN